MTPPPSRHGRLVCKPRIFIRLRAVPQVKFFIPEGLPLNSPSERTYKDESHGGVAPWLLASVSPDLRIAICLGRSGRFLWFPRGLRSVSGRRMAGLSSSAEKLSRRRPEFRVTLSDPLILLGTNTALFHQNDEQGVALGSGLERSPRNFQHLH